MLQQCNESWSAARYRGLPRILSYREFAVLIWRSMRLSSRDQISATLQTQVSSSKIPLFKGAGAVRGQCPLRLLSRTDPWSLMRLRTSGDGGP